MEQVFLTCNLMRKIQSVLKMPLIRIDSIEMSNKCSWNNLQYFANYQ